MKTPLLLLILYCLAACADETPFTIHQRKGLFLSEIAVWRIPQTKPTGEPWDDGEYPNNLPDVFVFVSGKLCLSCLKVEQNLNPRFITNPVRWVLAEPIRFAVGDTIAVQVNDDDGKANLANAMGYAKFVATDAGEMKALNGDTKLSVSLIK